MSLLDLRGFWANPADALAPSPTGVANVTGALSVTHNLTATVTGVGNGIAILSVKHNLGTGPVGVANVTAALGVTQRLAATVVAVANVSAALSGGSVLTADGTGIGWYRKRLLELPRVQPVPVRLEVLATGVGLLRGNLIVWSPTYSQEEIAALAALVDEEELAVLLTI